MSEVFRKVPRYPYEVSNHGRVYSYTSGKFLSPMRVGRKRKQYLEVELRNGVDAIRVKVHHLVLETFVGPPPYPDMVARHLDDDTTNNRLDNLVWGSRSENANDSVDNRTHNAVVIDRGTAAEIRRRRIGGERGAALAREYGISEQTVCDIYKGRIWK